MNIVGKGEYFGIKQQRLRQISRNVGLLLGIPLLVIVALYLLMNSAQLWMRGLFRHHKPFEENGAEVHSIWATARCRCCCAEPYREDTNRDGKIDDKDIIKYTVPDVGLFLQDIEMVNAASRDDDPNNDIEAYDYCSQRNAVDYLLPSLLIIVFVVVMGVTPLAVD